MPRRFLRFLFLILVFIVAIFSLWYFRSHSSAQVNGREVKVTTSFYPLYYFASQIGGDRLSVVNLTPAGAEPHDYEPTSQDIIQILNSRLLFLNGGVEPWGQKMKDNLQGKNTAVIDVGSQLMTQTVEEEGQNALDPHVWLSPVLAKQIVAKITAEIISIDKENESYYSQNGTNLQMKLTELDKDYRQGLQNCQTKDIVTSHAAFGYLASNYGLKQIPLAGLSPDAEPSLQELAKISSFIKEKHLKYIFFESLVSPKLSDTIAREVGAQTLVLNPLEGLTSVDSAAGKTYFTEMKNNLQNLRIALSCQ